ncbi:tRNA-specific adenosine deaminase 1, partial [Podochytrium sp. JEL0797]
MTPCPDTLAVDAILRLRKPEPKGKWSVAAAIVIDAKEVVAIGTGVKCLSFSAAQEAKDDLVADAHAEVLCRRAFLRYARFTWFRRFPTHSIIPPNSPDHPSYLIHQMTLAFTNQPSIYTLNDTTAAYPLTLRNPTPKFHMYISQSPCGDASTTSLERSQPTHEREVNESKRRKYLDGGSQPRSIPDPPAFERAKLKGDVLRGRDEYTRLGCLRTKPARVDAEMSLSMSCSDKLAKWAVVGVSGALLSLFAAPVFLDTVSVRDLFDREGLERAFGVGETGRLTGVKRDEMPTGFGGRGGEGRVCGMEVVESEVDFEFSKTNVEMRDGVATPSDVCLAWTHSLPPKDALQLLNSAGRKQGHAKRKGVWMPTSQSELCNTKLRAAFLKLVEASKMADVEPKVLRDVDVKELSYKELKELAFDYEKAKSVLLD